MYASLKSTVFCSALVFASTAARADQIYIAVSPQKVADMKPVIGAAGRAFNTLGPNGYMALIDAATGRSITTVAVPSNGRYRAAKFLNADFAPQVSAMRKALTEKAVPESTETQSDPLSVFRTISELRGNSTERAHVLIAASAVHVSKTDQQNSMLSGDGHLLIPSDGMLTAGLEVSPYGFDEAADKGSLAGSVIHWCAESPPAAQSYDIAHLRRFWSLWLSMRGATLASFTSDFSACASRFETRLTTAIAVEPLKKGETPEMLFVTNEGAVQQKRVQISLKPTAAEIELARLKAVVEKLKIVGIEFGPDGNPVPPQDKLAQVDRFNIFRSEPHPSAHGLTVMTGTEFRYDTWPRYDHAWCYMQFENKEGVTVHISVGSKWPGAKATWGEPPQVVLRTSGLTASEVKKAQSACRFPKE
jgi:hypothetical protein